ncbi:hypothetical protein [Streptomyces glycanivorans]|uniref:Uncharacterized protein n=1 Tax=Streptomyces glycanivorans TaxID=3033808 RepID=A0ABY9JEA0_9ACTN|nr:hypothetical protein [Streptomyces sp. Alt3]WLQ65139.1 hypothetical protein P8A20_16690 [Streptomyces sp. Alt3]
MHDRVSAVMQQVTCLRVATAGLALAVVAGWSSLLLVVMGRVVPGWAVGTGLCLVSLILMAVHVVRRVSADDTYPQGRRVLPRVALALLTAAAGLGSAAGAVSDLLGGADYRVLEPVGPYGCTAVVRETSFLKISDGVVYAVGPTGVAWRESGSWMADDIHRPVADGTYELSWNGSGVGTFRVRGTATDPIVASDVGPLDCG